MKNIYSLKILIISILAIVLTACSGNTNQSTASVTVSQTGSSIIEDSSVAAVAQEIPEAVTSTITVDYDSDDLETTTSSSDFTTILLEDDTISFQGSGVMVDGSAVTITAAGDYILSGSLNDGQVIIDSLDAETVHLVLNGVQISSSTSSPIYVRNAEKTVITLADGTENEVTDGIDYVLEEGDEPNAAIFSKDDLTINGNGSLTVNANFNNGITSKDDLKIISGIFEITSVNDGLKGRDSITVKDGQIAINAGGDGMQSNNDVDADKGNIFIEGGTLDITAEKDGIQAENTLVISGGNLVITSGGGSTNGTHISQQFGDWDTRNQQTDTSSEVSAKGLKAGINVTITGGNLKIDSADDSIHSNDSLAIYGGEFLLSSGDDGIHSDSSLEINAGNLNITQSYEGIESAEIVLNGGIIHLVASDDGVNGSTGSGGDVMAGGGGRGGFETGDSSLVINGGYLSLDAGGDGIDVNGSIEMTDGVVLVNGPTNNGNGPLDFGTFNITGGYLVAVGSSGMSQAPSNSSTQYSVMYNFDSVQSAGTIVHIETQTGEEILTFVPTKEYQSVVVSSPELSNGSTYLIYTGGSSTGSIADGLYSDGNYNPGTQVDSFTISSITTTAGVAGGGFMGGPGGKPPRGP